MITILVTFYISKLGQYVVKEKSMHYKQSNRQFYILIHLCANYGILKN